MAHTGAAPAASSGLAGLDSVLGGLLRGDNVAWAAEGDGDPVPFYRAATGTNGAFDHRLYVTLTEPPERVAARFTGVRVVDARPGAPLGRPGALLDHLHRRVREGRRPLVLFDPVEAMTATWGPVLTSRFVSRCTVLLLELNAVAYWSVRSGQVPARLFRQLNDDVQCSLMVEADRLRVAKAEGHLPSAAGSVLTYRVQDGLPAQLQEAPAVQRLGSALRALRHRTGLTQHDLGEAAGVSASAISQAERGQRGLSFATLLELTGRLNISFEELLDGRDVQPCHQVGRRRDGGPDGAAEEELLPGGAGPAVSVVRLPAGRSVSPGPGGHLVVIASAGVVEVRSAGARCVLRGGDVMAVHGAGVQGLRDLGSGSTVYLVRGGAGPC